MTSPPTPPRDLMPTLLFLLLLGLELLTHTSPLAAAISVVSSSSSISSSNPFLWDSSDRQAQSSEQPPPPLPQQQQQQQHPTRLRDHQFRDYYAIQIELPLDRPPFASSEYSLKEHAHTNTHHHHRGHRQVQVHHPYYTTTSNSNNNNDKNHHDDVLEGEATSTTESTTTPAGQEEMEQWIAASIDQAQAIGRLLGLEYESRVGSLLDYFLFSRPKPTFPDQEQQQQQKKGDDYEPSSPLPLQQGRAGLARRGLVVVDGSRSAVGGEGKGEGVGVGVGGAGARAGRSIQGGQQQQQQQHQREDEDVVTVVHARAVDHDQGQDQGHRPPTDNGYLEDLKMTSDPVVERFHALKAQYAAAASRWSSESSSEQQGQQDGSSSHRDKFAKRDSTYTTVQSMKTIQRQELKWRIKKRAPLPDPVPASSIMAEGREKGQVEGGVKGAGSQGRERRQGRDAGEELQEEEEEEDEVDDVVVSDDESEETIEEQGQKEESPPSSTDHDKVVSSEESAKGEDQPVGELQPDDGLAQRLNITDPGFKYQWHLFAKGSWDFNDNTAIPLPRLADDLHGTRCAGEIAAARNDLCGIGVAYGAKVAGLRILSGQITDVDEAAALNYNFHENHIYSCSWGPPDDGQSMDGPKGVVQEAIVNGIQHGRLGKGSIFVFATGNGGSAGDDCNFDGYTNSPYTVSIGAIDRQNHHAYYSEACSALLAVTYSNGAGSAIYTCDAGGPRKCFAHHGGTSAAAPLAAGMIALVLSVRPDLSWRDVQALLVQTAQPVSLDDEDWKPTATGRLFNHRFGYGRLDAYALVEAAKTFKTLGPPVFIESPVLVVQKEIPQDEKGILAVFEVQNTSLADDGKTTTMKRLGKLEHVTVTVNIAHERRGDVEVTLISPLGVESHLGVPRLLDQSKDGFVDWTFMTVKHWEEEVIGTWALRVRDTINPDFQGTFTDWRIKFWGEADLLDVAGQQHHNEGDGTTLPSGGDEAEGAQENGGGAGAGGGSDDESEDQEEPERLLIELEPTDGKGVPTTKTPDPVTSDETVKNENEKDNRPAVDSKDPPVGDNGKSSSDDLSHSSSSTGGDNEAEVDNLMEAIANPEDGSIANTKDEEVVASRAGHVLLIFGSIISVAGCAALLLFSKRRWDGRGRYASVSNMDRDHLGGEGSMAGSLLLLPRTNADTGLGRQGTAGRQAPMGSSGHRGEVGAGTGMALSRVWRGAVERMALQAPVGVYEDGHEPSARLARELLEPLESPPAEVKEDEQQHDNDGYGDDDDDDDDDGGGGGGSDTDSEDDWMGSGR
ncbi:pheromone processing endoprotease [Actinomortierella ambigua]|uniref:Pheromone processing endoprotease n=1 Tax=Actinomortierella ambigua TaxID=1343610 RepID=A0A9P6UA78_9FUNG|nr:pheromone processing endoprotease [Actinomortierella ambigua]